MARRSSFSNVLPTKPIALIYARVSSKEQEKEGFSIPAQLKLLQNYAAEQGLTVAEEFIDIETAKATGRTNFEKMLRHVRTHSTARVILVEKTDRLYRNLKDWVTVDELDLEIHFVKEALVLSRDSRSSEKFVHGIKVLMAKNYIDNLSEESRKGQQEKAEQGIWPSKAPTGYVNVVGPDGKKCIEPDPVMAPLVTKVFEWYATGTLSVLELGKKARAAGLVYRKSGVGITNSGIHAILRNRAYTGDFDWKGRTYHGRHQPLIGYDVWERVQDVIDKRYRTKVQTRSRRNFTLTGIIKCGHCGCSVVGETKKGKYVYYHCSGWKQKCPERYVREEVIHEKITELLGRLHFNDGLFDMVRSILLDSHAVEREDHDGAVARLHAESERLQKRIQAAYMDKMDGRIDTAFFDQMSESWRLEQEACLREIALLNSAEQSYMNEGVRLLELARKAQTLYEGETPAQRRELLKFVISNCVLKDGQLTAKFKQPFNMLAESTVTIRKSGRPKTASLAEKENWLGNLDSNQD